MPSATSDTPDRAAEGTGDRVPATGTLTGRDEDNAAFGRAFVPVLLLLTVLALGLFVLWNSLRPQPAGESFPSQGSLFAAEGTGSDFPYNSSPPTSGLRVDRLPADFILTTPLAPAEQVNILAYGNVLIQYNDAGHPELRQRLVELANIYNNRPTQLNLAQGHGVVVAPTPTLPPGQIAVTAWTHLLRLDSYDERAIHRFIETQMGDLDQAGK